MGTLEKLKLVSFKAGLKNPVFWRRNKLNGQLEEQIAYVKAAIAGDVFAAKRVKFVTDLETGTRKQVESAKRVKPWFFKTANGKIALTLRYGQKTLEIAKGKNAVEVGDMSELLSTLELISSAVQTGELDAQIETASSALRAGFKGKK